MDGEDLAKLAQEISGVVDGTSVLNAEACNGYFGNVADYTLNLEKRGHKMEVLHKTGGDLCSSNLEADAAETLHNEILSLSEKYYATPFPDPCLDAAAEVEALYPQLVKCSTAADCGYLAPDYTAIAADSISSVVVDDCSVVTTLPVANLSAVHNSLAKLQSALGKAQQACGSRIARDSCQGPKSFPSSAAPAVCQQGVCQLNPSLGF